MQIKIVDAMGLDLGNGFVKLKTGDTELLEPSVYSVVPEVDFMQGEDYAITIGNTSLYVGNTALASNLKVSSAVGITDALTRYTSKEYQKMLYSFIAVAYQQSIRIRNLVLGLPNNHFRECKDILKEHFLNKKYAVTYKGESLSIEIENVIVLPQPLGVYFRENIENKNLMIVDLGTGTNDYTEFNKLGNIINMFSNEEGLKKYHFEVLQYLQRKFPTIKMNVLDIPFILENGLIDMNNNNIKVVDGYIKRLQGKYAGYILQPLIEQYDHLSHFDEVILTGGGVLAFKDAILARKQEVGNIRIVERPQMANAEGFWQFAEAAARVEDE